MPPKNKCFPLNRFCSSCRAFKTDISLSGIRRVHFLKSEWEDFQPEDRVSIKYLVFRGVFCALVLVMVMLSLFRNKDQEFYLIYLTYWSLLTQNLYGILFFVDVLIAWIKFRRNANQRRVSPQPEPEPEEQPNPNTHDDADDDEEVEQYATIHPASAASRPAPVLMSPHLLKLNYLESTIYFLNVVCIVLPFVVTVGFWGFVANPATESGKQFLSRYHNPLFYSNMASVHGFNFILAAVNFFVIAIPIHVTHVVYLCGFGAVYLVFTGLYEVAHGKYPSDGSRPGESIYGFLNWKKKPGNAFLASIFAIFGAIIFFALVYCLYALRLFLVSRWKSNVYEEHCYDEHCYDNPNYNCNHCERGTFHRTSRRQTAPHCAHCATVDNPGKASPKKNSSQSEDAHPTSNPEEHHSEQPQSTTSDPDLPKDEESKPHSELKSNTLPPEVLSSPTRVSKKNRRSKLNFNKEIQIQAISREAVVHHDDEVPVNSSTDDSEVAPDDSASGDERVAGSVERKPSSKMYLNKPSKPRRKKSTRRHF